MHLFNKYLLSTHNMFDILLGSEESMMIKKDIILPLGSLRSKWEDKK